MKTARKAGTMKSWACIIMLTFLLPAGATQLTSILFTAVAQGGEKSPSMLASQQAADQRLADCPDSATEHTL